MLGCSKQRGQGFGYVQTPLTLSALGNSSIAFGKFPGEKRGGEGRDKHAGSPEHSGSQPCQTFEGVVRL